MFSNAAQNLLTKSNSLSFSFGYLPHFLKCSCPVHFSSTFSNISSTNVNFLKFRFLTTENSPNDNHLKDAIKKKVANPFAFFVKDRINTLSETLSYKERFTQLAQQWNQMSEVEKNVYRRERNEVFFEYKQKKTDYLNSLDKAGRANYRNERKKIVRNRERRRIKIKLHSLKYPKRPRIAYRFYLRDVLKEKYPDGNVPSVKNAEYIRIVGVATSRWRTMSELERLPYSESAKKDRTRFTEELLHWSQEMAKPENEGHLENLKKISFEMRCRPYGKIAQEILGITQAPDKSKHTLKKKKIVKKIKKLKTRKTRKTLSGKKNTNTNSLLKPSKSLMALFIRDRISNNNEANLAYRQKHKQAKNEWESFPKSEKDELSVLFKTYSSLVQKVKSPYATFLKSRIKSVNSSEMKPGQRMAIVAKEWKELPEDEREKFRTSRFTLDWNTLIKLKNKELKIETNSLTHQPMEPTTTKELLELLQYPKRPLTAYRYFMQEKREKVNSQWRQMSKVERSQFTKNVSEQWKEMDDPQREPYVQRANADRARQDRELAKWRLQMTKPHNKSKLTRLIELATNEGPAQVKKIERITSCDRTKTLETKFY